MDIVPLDAWYSFQADVACGQAGPPSSDVAERKRRAALRREERAEGELRQSIRVCGCLTQSMILGFGVIQRNC